MTEPLATLAIVGGVLMYELIARAVGTSHGQEMSPARLDDLIRGLGRVPPERTTHDGTPSPGRRAAALTAGPIAEIEQTPFGRRRPPPHAPVSQRAPSLRQLSRVSVGYGPKCGHDWQVAVWS